MQERVGTCRGSAQECEGGVCRSVRESMQERSRTFIPGPVPLAQLSGSVSIHFQHASVVAL